MRLDLLPTQPKEEAPAEEGREEAVLNPAKPDQINLAAMPNQPEDMRIPEIGIAPDKPGIEVPISKKELFEKRTELFANRMMKDVYGEEKLKELALSEKKIEFFMSRAPRIALLYAAPLYAVAYEALDQGKSLLVSSLKDEAYSPFERRILSELLPQKTPTALKVASSLTEVLADIALVGGAMNLAKQGALTQAVKEVGVKLEQAGYGTGKLTVTKEAIKKAVRGTNLWKAMKTWVKAKNIDVRMHTSKQIGKGTSVVKTPVTGKEIEVLRPPLRVEFGDKIVRDAAGKPVTLGAEKFVEESDITHFQGLIGDDPFEGAGDYKTVKEYYSKVKGKEGKVVYMSPDEYIRRTGEGFWSNLVAKEGSEKAAIAYANKGGYAGTTKEEIITQMMDVRISEENIKKIADYEKIYMPHLEYEEGYFSQEGHHRALYAKQLGIEEIPVVVAYPTGQPEMAGLGDPAKILTPEEQRVYFNEIKDEIAYGEKGYRQQLEDGTFIGIGSTYPDYFKNKGYSQALANASFKNLESGKELTPKQEAFIEDMRKAALTKKQRDMDYEAEEEALAKAAAIDAEERIAIMEEASGVMEFPDSAVQEKMVQDSIDIRRFIKENGEKPVELAGTQGKTVYIHKSTKEPGKWQVSYFQKGQAIGDSIRRTYEEVLTIAIKEHGVELYKAPEPGKLGEPGKPKPKKKFKEPTHLELITAQNRYAELLGVKKFVEPLERGKMEYDLERRTVKNEIASTVKELEKLKTVTTEEMAVALNTNIEAPKEFGEKEKAIFNYFRGLTRDMLRRVNEVRERTGRDPIKDIGAYFRHIVDIKASDIVAGRELLPEKLKAWAEKNITGDVRNPMELERKIKDELLKYFSKDLGYVMSSMINTALKEVHLDEAKDFLAEMLAAAQIDPKVLAKMSPEEQALYRAEEELPNATKQWIEDYVKIVLLDEKQTTIDQKSNRWIAPGTPVADYINKKLEPFGKQLSERAFTDMLVALSKLPIYGVIGGARAKLIIRNKIQITQNIALYGVRNTFKGTLPTSDYPVLEELKTESLFLRTYSGIEEMPADIKGKFSKYMMASFQWSALSNVNQAMNAAYHWTAENIQDPLKKDLDWADPQRTYTEDKNFFYPSERELLLKEMEYGAQTTQYQYIGMAMPGIFRIKSLAPLTRLQSWWMNHWAIFVREAATRAITGKVGYTIETTIKGPDGEDIKIERQPKISVASRMNFLKWLVIAGVTLNTLGYGRSYLFGTAPTGVPPSAQLAFSAYKFFTTSGVTKFGRNEKRKAAKEMKQAALTFIPGYLTVKDLTALLSGEKPWNEYLFYNKIREKQKVTFN